MTDRPSVDRPMIVETEGAETMYDGPCTSCGSRNWVELEGDQAECHDCGQTFTKPSVDRPMIVEHRTEGAETMTSYPGTHDDCPVDGPHNHPGEPQGPDDEPANEQALAIELDGLTVTVESAGVDTQPWGHDDAWSYLVTVEAAENPAPYITKAWGSIHAFVSGKTEMEDAESIGYMVLDELVSAYNDPDEFWAMAVGDDRLTRDKAQQVLWMIETAEAMEAALARNADAIAEGAER